MSDRESTLVEVFAKYKDVFDQHGQYKGDMLGDLPCHWFSHSEDNGGRTAYYLAVVQAYKEADKVEVKVYFDIRNAIPDAGRPGNSWQQYVDYDAECLATLVFQRVLRRDMQTQNTGTYAPWSVLTSQIHFPGDQVLDCTAGIHTVRTTAAIYKVRTWFYQYDNVIYRMTQHKHFHGSSPLWDVHVSHAWDIL